MSNLRLLGCFIGVMGFVATFMKYRGPQWKKSSFVLLTVFNLMLVLVSLYPDIMNVLVGIFALQSLHYARILILLIFSTILLWLLVLYQRARLEEYRHQFDLLVRGLAREERKAIVSEKIARYDIIIVIPAFNETQNLNILLPTIPKTILNKRVGVLVVDDGSDDDTKTVVTEHDCMYVRNLVNRGQGAASRLGYDILCEHNVSYGITMDADNQHSVSDLQTLLGPIVNGFADLIIGSRYLGSSHTVSFMRDIGNRVLTKVISILINVKLTDCSSGFKAFNVEKIKPLVLMEDQFQSAEVLIEAAKKGLRIGEVPITITPRMHGTSRKGHDISYGFNFIKTIIKAWWR